MTIPRELQRSVPRHVTLAARGWVSVLTFLLNLIALLVAAVWLNMRPGHTVSEAQIMPLWTLTRLVVCLLLITVLDMMRIWRLARLLTNGRATIARVTGDVTPWWYRLRRRTGRRTRRLQCEFRLLNGGLCKATVELPPGVAPDADIVVVYDPDQPERATLYPSGMLKVG